MVDALLDRLKHKCITISIQKGDSLPPCVRTVVALENRTLELHFPYQNGGSKTQNQAKNELFSNIFNILAGSDPNKT